MCRQMALHMYNMHWIIDCCGERIEIGGTVQYKIGCDTVVGSVSEIFCQTVSVCESSKSGCDVHICPEKICTMNGASSIPNYTNPCQTS